MTQSLQKLLRQTGLWRASSIDHDYKSVRSTGFRALDDKLPGGGWPADGITELLHDQYGLGEFRLLLPVLTQLSQELARWLLLVKPPYIPYPPALTQAGIDLAKVVISQPKTTSDYLWVLEKALASQSCSVVLCWPEDIHEKQIRRLQVASKEGGCWGIMFRPEKVADQPSPAELRIRLRPGDSRQDNSQLIARILKRKGGWESTDLSLEFDDQLLRPTPDFSEMHVEQSGCSPIFNQDKGDQQHTYSYEYQ